jgi:hypothetical protein
MYTKSKRGMGRRGEERKEEEKGGEGGGERFLRT